MSGVVVTLGLAAGAWAAEQHQWGQWHSRNMVSSEKNLPEMFDPATGKNVRWVVDLGSQSYGTPIVAGGKVLIGTNNDVPRDPRHKGDRGVLLCLDEKDGRLLWQLVVPKIGGDIYLDWPRAGIVSAPTVEGDRAYVMTNRAEIVCLDMKGLSDGNDGPYREEAAHQTPKGSATVELGPTDADIVWVFDMVSQAGIHPHDAGHASPLIDGDLLYVNSSNGVDNTHRKIRKPDAPSLVVLDKRTGRLVAKDAEQIGPRVFHSTWSSPAMGEVGGKPLVFFGGGDGVVYAFEALSGVSGNPDVEAMRRVWRFDCDPSAPKEEVHRYTGNRQVSPSNIKSMPVFVGNRVYVTVGGDLWWGKRKGWLKCIDATKTGEITEPGEVWSYPTAQICSTPAVSNGLVFVGDIGRTLHCVDVATGKVKWTHMAKGEFWGSPMVADGKVYVGSRRGDFHVLAAEGEKKVLYSVDLDSEISATATMANETVYIATMRKLYAFGKK